MNIQKFSYHTHTDFSDGANTLEEMLEQAVKLGWSEIGISDHLTLHKSLIGREKAHVNGFEKKLILENQIKKIRNISNNYPIKTLIGFEVDFFTYDGWLENIEQLTNNLDVDYLLSGTHYSENGNEAVSVITMKNEFNDIELQRTLISKHFNNIKAAVESKMFDFIAHLDFVRWGGICGINDFQKERMLIIEALADTKTPYELNTKGLRSINDFYPALWMVEELHKRNVPIVISDDAHHISDLGKGYDKAEILLSELGYKNRWKLNK